MDQSTISRDLDVLAEYMAEHLGKRALLEVRADADGPVVECVG